MVRIATERISELFARAESEAAGSHPELADRYVALARRIGMRYNVRLPREFAEKYCRACSRFWVEGRTVRTRLRSGHRVRRCLGCGRERRIRYGRPGRPIRPTAAKARRRASSGARTAPEERMTLTENGVDDEFEPEGR